MIYGTAVGRITKDAELRFTASGSPVLGFTVASDVGYGDKKHAVFTKCSMWGKRGEAVEAYVKKGTPVTVIGALDLTEREYNGKTYKDLEMNVSELVLQGSRSQSSDNRSDSDNGFRQPQPGEPGSKPTTDFDDDDIPF